MYILYISIILVVLGFVFILTSVEKKRVVVNDDDALYVPPVEPLQEINLSDTDYPQRSSIAAEKADESVNIEKPPADDIFEIVIYNDESGVALANGNVDASTLKNLSREGRGTADVTKDAVTVRIEKKLFRFDFHQVANIKCGSNYIALFLKKSKSSRLFVFRSNPDLSARAKEIYNNFSSNVFHL